MERSVNVELRISPSVTAYFGGGPWWFHGWHVDGDRVDEVLNLDVTFDQPLLMRIIELETVAQREQEIRAIFTAKRVGKLRFAGLASGVTMACEKNWIALSGNNVADDAHAGIA